MRLLGLPGAAAPPAGAPLRRGKRAVLSRVLYPRGHVPLQGGGTSNSKAGSKHVYGEGALTTKRGGVSDAASSGCPPGPHRFSGFDALQ